MKEVEKKGHEVKGNVTKVEVKRNLGGIQIRDLRQKSQGGKSLNQSSWRTINAKDQRRIRLSSRKVVFVLVQGLTKAAIKVLIADGNPCDRL